MRLALSVFVAGFCCAATPSFASDIDPLTPVREVLALTEENWADDTTEWKDIFSEERRTRLFSAEFVDLYVKASEKVTKESESEAPLDPFGYDVVTSSQDGCPLKDLTINLAGEKDGKSEVVATFRNADCWDSEEARNVVTRVHFDVVAADGRPVIADIRHEFEGEFSSALQELRDVLSYQPE